MYAGVTPQVQRHKLRRGSRASRNARGLAASQTCKHFRDHPAMMVSDHPESACKSHHENHDDSDCPKRKRPTLTTLKERVACLRTECPQASNTPSRLLTSSWQHPRMHVLDDIMSIMMLMSIKNKEYRQPVPPAPVSDRRSVWFLYLDLLL